MRKRFVLFTLGTWIVMILFSSVGFTQKVGFKTIKIDYIHLPLYPLESGLETFQSKLELVLPDESMEIDQLLSRYLKIPGYQKTKSNPDIRIIVTFGDYELKDKNIQTKEVFNVNEGKNLTGYLYQLKFDYPVNLKVISSGGEELCNMEIPIDTKILEFEFGKWEYSKEDLDRKFESEGEQLLLDKQKNCITKALSTIREVLNSYYGKAESTERIKIASGRGRKYNYSDLEKAIGFVERAFSETVDLLAENKKGLNELESAIEIWHIRIGKDDATRKKDGTSPEIYQMLWYNCAVSYLWVKEFNLAREALASARNITGDVIPKNHLKMLNEMEEMINDLEKRYLANSK